MHGKSHLFRVCLQILTLALVLLTGGCATHGLWVNARLDNFHEPSVPHGLAIYELPGQEDFLVQYDDLAPNGRVVRRSCPLMHNQGATASARMPHFLDEAITGLVSPLPSFPDSKSNHAEEKGAYAVLS